MQNPDAASDAGFTLIEVIISFIILTTVLGSATLSLSYTARLQRQGEMKRGAMICAQRVLAEHLDRRRGLPASETGTDSDNCRWRIARRAMKLSHTESGRSLMAFRLEILSLQGRAVETFDTYYAEDL